MNITIKRGTLYLANLSPRKGTEPGKIRPVLVIQSDLLNEVQHPSTLILPLTTKLTEPNVLRVRIPKGMAKIDKESDVMIDQCRAIDNKRLISALGSLPSEIFDEVAAKFQQVAGF